MTALEESNFNNSDSTPPSRHRFQSMILDCLGCKWTILLMEKIAAGVNRPGKLTKNIDGLTTKVLNQSLNKMIDYGILKRTSFAEIPPRVEYYLTPFGFELMELLLQMKSLQAKYF